MNVANKYRPGAINVQVNGKQVEDLYQEWLARERECEVLRKANKTLSEQLAEQGKLIKELKERLFQAEN